MQQKFRSADNLCDEQIEGNRG